MNVNNGAQQYTECLSAADEDATVPVTPVCRYLYIGDVVHFFVEAPGANRYNVTVTINANTEPMELVINAVVSHDENLISVSVEELWAVSEGKVSHDENLISVSVEELWAVSEGKVSAFHGTFQDYKKMLQSS
nr:abc transporter f family member 3 [Quercus suber]